MIDYDWLIVGGGPQGRFTARAIADAAPDARLALVDPAPPLAAWHRRAAATGMVYLRSSNAHHLGRRADSLRRFMATDDYDGRHLLGYYQRPSLALFNAHAATELGQPAQLHTTATAIEAMPHGWHVQLDDGRVASARRVVLATGPGTPYRPAGLAGAAHVFDADFDLGAPGRRTVIIGGGLSGAQLALRAVEAGHRVAWLTRREPIASDFDAEPRYAGPRGMTPFLSAPPDERTAMLAAARRPGTLPPDIHTAITAAIAGGELAWLRGEAVAETADGLRLVDGREIAAERVILATGFAPRPAADSLLGRTMARLGVDDDGQGHLPVDEALQIAPGLHVIGRPASQVLGPMAGNVKGARWAGQRLAAIARDDRTADTTRAIG